MKKIININLAGRAIPIEDAAFTQLQAYIESLRRYFANEEGRDEIINDIESRIAELMSEKVRKSGSVITEEDVAEILNSMGRPEDFDADADAAFATSAGTGGTETETERVRKRRGRLYRNGTDKILGGVCSGFANYINVDPAIIRLLFAIITFGGFGFGFLLYILLWIILPERTLDEYRGKRIFRNPDDRVISGVAGGLAAYFNWESWTVRLIFAIPLVLNILLSVTSGIFFHFDPFPGIFFGSLMGTFVLAYIVLWIVLPEARTPYQKMEMRGEKVDVNAIRQNVREGMSQVKERAQTFGDEVRTAADNLSQRAKRFSETRGKEFAGEVSRAAAPIGSGIGHAIGTLFRIFFIVLAGSIAFALFIGLMVLIVGGMGVLPLKNFLLDGMWQNVFAWGTLVFFLAVPVVGFIIWLVRRSMNVRSQSRYLGWTFGGLWTLGWISVTLLVSSLVKDFRSFERVAEPVAIMQPEGGKMTVVVSEPMIRYSGNYWWFDADDAGWDLSDDTLKMSNVKIRVVKSEDTSYQVNVFRYSAGSNRTNAEERAENIVYNTRYTDSTLHVGSGLAIGKEDKFRAQEVVVEIAVPVGKQIRFDASVADKLHPFSIRTRDNNGWRRSWNRRNWEIEVDFDRFFDWDVNTDYTMGSDGRLRDDSRVMTREEREQELRDRERRLEEEQRRIEEERKRLNDSLRSNNNIPKTESGDESGFTTAQFNSPLFSILKIAD